MENSRTADMVADMDNQEIDKAILAAKKDIEDQINEEIPLIGQRIPLAALAKDFENDEFFSQQLQVCLFLRKNIYYKIFL